jgi:hypothetical protein
MASNRIDYDLTKVQFSLGGERLSGSGQGAASGGLVTFSPNAARMERTSGADGFQSYSRNNDNSWKAEVTVTRGSKAYKTMSDQLSTQKGQYPIESLPLLCYDPVSGDRISSQYTIFMEEPEMGFGATNGEATFILDLPSPTVRRGLSIS